LPIIIFRNKKYPIADPDYKKTLIVGCVAGLFLFFGATFQQLGLVYTTAGKAGFVTGLYVIIVPLLGMIWGDLFLGRICSIHRQVFSSSRFHSALICAGCVHVINLLWDWYSSRKDPAIWSVEIAISIWQSFRCSNS